jgi:uncharacterized protein involved in high-affinity Fe2+ transport
MAAAVCAMAMTVCAMAMTAAAGAQRRIGFVNFPIGRGRYMCTNLFGMIFFQPVEILNLETFHLPKSGFGSKRNAIARLAAGAMTVCAMAAAR